MHDYTVERQKTSAAAQETIISQLKLASRHFLLCFLLYTCGISPQQQQQQPRQIIDRPSQQQQQQQEKLHSIASLSALLALLSSAAAWFHYKTGKNKNKNRAADIKFKGIKKKGERSRESTTRRETKKKTERLLLLLLAAGVVGVQFSRRRLIFFFFFLPFGGPFPRPGGATPADQTGLPPPPPPPSS